MSSNSNCEVCPSLDYLDRVSHKLDSEPELKKEVLAFVARLCKIGQCDGFTISYIDKEDGSIYFDCGNQFYQAINEIIHGIDTESLLNHET